MKAPEKLVAITPSIPGRRSMAPEVAKRIVTDKGNAFMAEAVRVLESGPYWVTP